MLVNITRKLALKETNLFSELQNRRRYWHFIYSSFRNSVTCRVQRVHRTCSAFMGTSLCLAVASYTGEIFLFHCHLGNLIERHGSNQLFVTSLQCAPLDIDSSIEYAGSPKGQLLSFGAYDTQLWNSSALNSGALYNFDGFNFARFNNRGTMFSPVSTQSVQEVLLHEV
ncbi:hypothetical protein L7F22_027176 [Adiantum nelumboides]|nr:hypothetical protein [Adiantum nelumboides]